MRRLAGTLIVGPALLLQSGCLELVGGTDGSASGSYSADGFYSDPIGSWYVPSSDSCCYEYETEYYADEWIDEDYWVEDDLWAEEDGWYYDSYYDEWYYYDWYYDEWYYYDEYYDEWYYYDDCYDEWYYYDDDGW
jgi:serine protease Do